MAVNLNARNLKPPSYFSRHVRTTQGQHDDCKQDIGPELIPPSLFQKRKQKVDKQNQAFDDQYTSSRQMKDAAVSVYPPSIHAEEVKASHTATVMDPPASPTKFAQFSHSHLKELSEATKAIIELNKENVELLKRSKVEEDERTHRHDSQKEGYRMPSEPKTIAFYQEPRPVDYHHSHILPIQHTSQLITKQASEIGQLKAEIQNLTAHYQQQMQEFKSQVQDHERENARAIGELEAKLKRSIDSHATAVEHIKALSEQKQNQLEETIQVQSIEVERSMATLKEVCDQKLQLERKLESTEIQYKTQLRDCEEEIGELKGQVRRLQAYISDSLASTKTTATWQVEKQHFNQQIKNLEKECLSLKTSFELTNLRLTSAIEIQAIQELELSKESHENFTKTENLLTKWRESVFKLMVQRKSQELTMKMNDKNHKQQVDDLQAKLQSLNNEIEILNHKMSDGQAQLQIQLNRNKDLEEEVVSLHQVAAILDQRLEDSAQVCLQMKSTVNKHVCSVSNIEEAMQSALRNLSCYDHRISFAVSRIEMLKGLFQRKDAIWKLKVDGMASVSGASQDVMHLSTANRELELKEELKQTIEERDLLASRLKDDAELALHQMRATTNANENNIQEKEDKIQELKDLLAAKSKSAEISCEKLLELESQLKEAHTHMADLEENLIQQRRKSMKVSDERQQVLDAEYCSQLAAMECHVNTARREHTKAVVCMRQCERQAVREKQRLEDLIKSQETFYKSEVEKLQRHVNNLQKDNNILKVTLRQEGLMGRCKTGGTEIQQGQGDVHFKEPHEQSRLDAEQPGNDPSFSNLVDDVMDLTSHVFTSD